MINRQFRRMYWMTSGIFVHTNWASIGYYSHLMIRTFNTELKSHQRDWHGKCLTYPIWVCPLTDWQIHQPAIIHYGVRKMLYNNTFQWSQAVLNWPLSAKAVSACRLCVSFNFACRQQRVLSHAESNKEFVIRWLSNISTIFTSKTVRFIFAFDAKSISFFSCRQLQLLRKLYCFLKCFRCKCWVTARLPYWICADGVTLFFIVNDATKNPL